LRIIFLILIILSSLIACNNRFEEYKEVSPDVYMKLYTFDESSKSYNNSDYISASIRVKVEEETIYNRKKEYTFQPNSNGLEIIFKKLNEGDSASFMIKREQVVNNNFGFNVLDSKKDYLEVIVKSHKYYNEKQHNKYLKSNDFEMLEQNVLNKYIKNLNLDSSSNEGGVHIIYDQKTGGNLIKKGDVVFVHYVGTTIDKNEFDNTYKRNEPFEYTVGASGQLIEGLEIAIKRMREGEKAKIIIPSQLAFGEQGSSTGIVTPFTTVIYNLEIIKVN